MRSRRRVPKLGWLARNRDSVQPVHSWPDNQITGGRLAAVVAASAIVGPKLSDNPIYTAAAEHTFIKSLRETPPAIDS